MRGRIFTLALTLLPLTLGQPLAEGGEEEEGEPLEIGSRLELFVDDYLIESMEGLRLQLQEPQSGGKVLSFDKPWEGTTSALPNRLQGRRHLPHVLSRQQPCGLHLSVAPGTRRGTDSRARAGSLLCREQGRHTLDASLSGTDRVPGVQGQQHRLNRRFMEAFVRPGRHPKSWVHRTNMISAGVVPTADDEVSIYAARHYTSPSAHLERMFLRTDGFASLHADYAAGELLTRPLQFQGDNLVLNFSTSAAGSLGLPPRTSPPSKLDSEPFEVHSKG